MRILKLFVCTATLLFVLVGVGFSADANSMENIFGVGIGLPYGGIGVNYELSINDSFAPTAGVGILGYNVGWNAGVRFYYPGRDNEFRGRISALYGTNTVIEIKTWSKTEYETRTGFSGGIGFNWRFGRNWAFDGDLLHATNDVHSRYEKKSGDVLVALGLSRRW